MSKAVTFLNNKLLPLLKDPLQLNRWVLQRPDENESRISILVGGMGYPRSTSYDRPQVSMFVEDMCLGIMPYRSFAGEDSEFSVRLARKDVELDKILTTGLDKKAERVNKFETPAFGI